MRYAQLFIAIMLATSVLPIVPAFAQADLSAFSVANGSPTGAASPLDLLIDSDSYVPPFYSGRALSSAGSRILLQALPYFKNADGSLIPDSSINFIWKQDDRVLGSLSGLGRSSVSLPAAILYGTTDIEVDAYSSDGSHYGIAAASIPSAEVQLVMYENNPLLGLELYSPLGSTATVPETEMTFAVVPYFAHIQNPNDTRLSYHWTVNGSNITPTRGDPSELVLNAKGSDGQAMIGLSLMQSDDMFLVPSATWNISLGANASGNASAASGTKNPFMGQ